MAHSLPVLTLPSSTKRFSSSSYIMAFGLSISVAFEVFLTDAIFKRTENLLAAMVFPNQ